MAIGFEKELSELIASASVRIDVEAGKTRLKYITDTPGQQATYIAKLDDARNYAAAGYPEDVSPYPWIAAESVATASTPAQAANNIIVKAAEWSQIGAIIEGARQLAKRSIVIASNAQQVYRAEKEFLSAMSNL